MKTKIQSEPNANLARWITDERAEQFFGRPFKIKAAILVHMITGDGSLSEIAREHGISRQAVHEHARHAREIYFPPRQG